MKKHNDFLGSVKDNKYIITRPARLSDVSIDDIDDADANEGWREKSRQLQARRWRKIRHQMV